MGVSSAVFESAGKRTEHYVPGVYTRSYNVTSPNGVSSGNLVIMGTSNGGEPDKLLEFGTLAEAKEALVSGDLLNAIGYAFNGSDDFIPQKVFGMRVNKGVQSALTLSSGGTEILSLKAWDYGSHTNQLKIWVQAGSESNSTKFTVVYKSNTYESDDIIRKSLSIEYAGEGSAKVEVTSTGITLTETVDEVDTAQTFLFADYDTIGTLVARINDTENFVASILNGEDDSDSADLDTLTATDITSSAITLYSNLAAFIEELEKCSYIGSVTLLTTSTRQVPAETDNYVYFTGGDNGGNGTGAEWSAALEVLETEDIQIIATPSTDTVIQNLIATHCKQMSTTVNRKERTCILGAAIGTSDDDAITQAIAFNSKNVSYVCDYGTAANPLTGETETVSPAIVAVMLAGMESAMSVSEPLTNKAINLSSFAKIRTITNMEKLIKKGILVCNPSPDNMSNFVVIRALTTYQGSGDLISCERSMVREDYFMNRDFRSKFSSGIGHPNKTDIATIKQTLLDAAKEWATNGYIVPSDGNENVWDVKITVNGDKIYVKFSRYLTAPLNFIFATATNNVYTSTVEV